MTHQEIRDKFKTFFESKGHKWVPSSSLLPTDPSVLFTTAGMQQFKDFYSGRVEAMESFSTLNVASIQKCMRTSEIDIVGDDSHLTFFEMFGNFSFGGYWKKEAIQYAHEFITKEMGLSIDYVTVFGGENNIPADIESEELWKSIDHKLEIRKMTRTDNFWGPTGSEGPCGPSTEIYVKDVEIWNVVFNQYYQDLDGKLNPLKIKGIDTGMGIERLAMVIQKKNNIFETDLLNPILKKVGTGSADERRIITDHARASVFLMSAGISPSNKEQGYVLRRLLRRILLLLSFSGSTNKDYEDIFKKVIEIYKPVYNDLDLEKCLLITEEENQKFSKTVKQGIAEMNYFEKVGPVEAFHLYQSFGLPFEVIKHIDPDKTKDLTRDGFETERKRHQEISRAGAEKKFGGHGMSSDVQMDPKKTRLHTATHIVVAALEKVLGEKLTQAGSDINEERLRFDFKFGRKVTPEELKQAEDMANDIVTKDLPVTFEEMNTDDAFTQGAAGAFRHKYGDRVKVYTIGDQSNPFSKEICGGPHVTHAGEVGHITITKEESVSGGNRRIRATIK